MHCLCLCCSSSPISVSTSTSTSFSSRHFLPWGRFLQFKPLLFCPKLPLLVLPTPLRNSRRNSSSKEQQLSVPFPFPVPDRDLELESGGEEDDDDDFDEYEDDEITADEYVVDVDASEEEEDEEDEEEKRGERSDSDTAGPLGQSEEDKAERVKKLIAEAREFGAEIIDYQELAAIYDFPIDRFQRLAIQAFLRGSSVVVSAPTSSGKTLIAEASALATLARARRLFYTTPLKALSNQKLRDFR